jgi:hypothetical protein
MGGTYGTCVTAQPPHFPRYMEFLRMRFKKGPTNSNMLTARER